MNWNVKCVFLFEKNIILKTNLINSNYHWCWNKMWFCLFVLLKHSNNSEPILLERMAAIFPIYTILSIVPLFLFSLIILLLFRFNRWKIFKCLFSIFSLRLMMMIQPSIINDHFCSVQCMQHQWKMMIGGFFLSN